MLTLESPPESSEPPDPPARAPWPLRLLLALSVLLLVLAGTAEMMREAPRTADPATPESPGPLDTLIVPGHRVSFILLGLPVADVEKRLGAGVIRPSDGALLYLFEKHGLGCGVQQSLIVSIRILTPEFKTRGGVGVGGDVDLAVRELGDRYEFTSEAGTPSPAAAPPENYVLHYWAQGIHVGVKHTRIDSILITPPVEGNAP